MKARLFGVLVASLLWPLAASAAGQERTIEIAVTQNGFEPARVKVAKGEPLKLVVTRKTDQTCAKEIVIPDENIRAELPLGKPVTLSFTPERSGEIRYACGMNMITGVLEVASAGSTGDPSASDTHPAGREPTASGHADHHQHADSAKACGCMHGRAVSNGS